MSAADSTDLQVSDKMVRVISKLIEPLVPWTTGRSGHVRPGLHWRRSTISDALKILVCRCVFIKPSHVAVQTEKYVGR